MSLRSVVHCLSLALLLVGPYAQAGTYTWTTKDANGYVTAQSPSFSGGVVNIVTSVHAPGKSNTRPPVPFSTSNGHYTGSGGCEVNSNIASNTPGSVKVNSPANPIVATFTWQATSSTDLPPPAVIVQQNCTASWSWGAYLGTGMATGSADCGLPNATVSTTTDSLGRNSGSTSSGVRYSVVPSPGASFSIPVSGSYQPTASTSATSGSSGDASSSASVSYQVQAFPVVVSLGGTIKDSNNQDNILIGQECSATLSAGPFSLSGFQWNPGGSVFSQFAVASDQSTGQVIPVASDEWQQPNPYWHYLQDSGGSPFSVTCSATASVNGTAIGTVSGQRNVQVWVPYYFMGANVNPCTIVGDLMQAGGPDTNSQPGINFTGRIGTPALFRSGGGVSSSACGFGAFLQLCSINENLYSSVAATQTNATNGYELDNIWPFYGQFNANSTDATPNTASAPDSPGLDVNVFTDKVGVTDDFQMYLMYQPPGNDAQWVPLDRLTWHWYIDTTEVGSQWIPTPPGTVVADTDKRWMVHPEWTSRYTNPVGQL